MDMDLYNNNPSPIWQEWLKDPDAYEAKLRAEDKTWRSKRAGMQSNVIPPQPGETMIDFQCSDTWHNHYDWYYGRGDYRDKSVNLEVIIQNDRDKEE